MSTIAITQLVQLQIDIDEQKVIAMTFTALCQKLTNFHARVNIITQ